MRLRKDYGKIPLRQDGRATEMGNKWWNPSFKCEGLTCREWAIIIYPMEGFLMFSLACFPIKGCWCHVPKQLQHIYAPAYISYQWASRNVGRFYRTSNQTSATKTSITLYTVSRRPDGVVRGETAQWWFSSLYPLRHKHLLFMCSVCIKSLLLHGVALRCNCQRDIQPPCALGSIFRAF